MLGFAEAQPIAAFTVAGATLLLLPDCA